MAEGVQRDAKRSGHHAQRFENADDAWVAMAPTPMKRT